MDIRPSKRRRHSSLQDIELEPNDMSANKASSGPATSPALPSQRRFKVSKPLSSRSLPEPGQDKAMSSWTSPGRSIFRLQTDELLKKLRPKYETRMDEAERTVRRLQDIISDIPNRQRLPVRIIRLDMLRITFLTLLFPSRYPRLKEIWSNLVLFISLFQNPLQGQNRSWYSSI